MPKIMSMVEIENLLREQAKMRSPENDDMGVLDECADHIKEWLAEDEMAIARLLQGDLEPY